MSVIRDWLPVCEDVSVVLDAALAQTTPAETWHAFRQLARRDVDFPSMMRIDRTVRKYRAAAETQEAPAGFQPIRLAILSTSTTTHLGAALRVTGLGRGLLIDLYEPDYGQYRQEIANPASGLHAFKPSAVLFAQDPYALAGTIGEGADGLDERIASVIGGMRKEWARARSAWGATVLQQLPFIPFPRLMGENEHRLAVSPVEMLRRFQDALRIAADEEKVDLVDLEYWASRVGLHTLHSEGLWHRAKQEIIPTMTPLYGDVVARLLAARFGRSAKCLVLDLDNTVWGGVIGDDGMEGITIGQGSAVGEGHLALQAYAKRLARRGIILAVCSKNDDDVARKPFESHPEMLLKLDDISCFVANWTDKATNLRRIAKELNIGLDALVFADDNPFERELIRAEAPDVFVPNLGEDVADYVRMIADSGYFEATTLTAEDLAKTEQYAANARRQEMLEETTDLEGYLAALEMKLKFASFDDIGFTRIVQLINKTNQFNLTTRRYTEAEARAVMDDPDGMTLQLRLLDRFGDNGMIAVVIGRRDPATATLDIDTWLMSCRVLGRQVEEATLGVIADWARANGVQTITGTYVPTERNSMVADHYAKLGFASAGEADGRTRWSLSLADYKPVATFIEKEAA